ncbi:acetoacetate decarboxylase family protein [Phormidium sp. LEGE 05292]|uniref:acetoacetate decarboxylase family protein n=1 Tax=[Phormidium] sp. LEGE 05292 TaxID=767427 RepID=UPI001881ACA0|nr:acetoacetate decarboxylase family protein [Phormidium sp. LEGE 05292]MBE9228464.1 acetoacetate decarboxylase family protein [Phormidium sp. LEGE 05292]
MSYPTAPWTLKGYAVQTVQLVDIERSRPLIPQELEIFSVWPGKTIGGVYLSSYKLGSVLQYNELIVVAGMVSYAGKIGAWISHIYVDNSDSVAGGREIWGLPKELAEFTWLTEEESSVIVRQEDKELCSLTYTKPSLALPVSLALPIFGSSISDFLLFKGEFAYRVGLVNGKLQVPTESPFGSLNLGQPWLTAYCDDLRLVVNAPEVVGERKVEFSYS